MREQIGSCLRADCALICGELCLHLRVDSAAKNAENEGFCGQTMP
jgi:hypothetical protein